MTKRSGDIGPDGTVTAIVGALAAGEISAAELLEQSLARIEQSNARLRAFISVDADSAKAAAAKADSQRAQGGEVPPLLGVPIAVKDNLSVANAPTTGGTWMLADYTPTRNAAVVDALLEAGAVIVGKTNLHEAAFGITSKNPHYGTIRNPHDESRIAGGSSGGTAAAVAAGLCPAGIGTDTGGSVRVPAALCGLVGVRPPAQMVPRAGLMSLSWTCDSIGPITRSVADARLLLAAMSGTNLGDAEAPVLALSGVRLGVLTDEFADSDPETERVMSEFRVRLEAAGADVSDVELEGAADAMPYLFDVVLPESWIQIQEVLEDARPGASLAACMDELGQDVRAALAGEAGLEGERVPAQRYLAALREARPALQAAAAKAFRNFDALVCPTTPTPAVGLEEEPEMDFKGHRVPTFQTFIRNCCFASFADLPAVSVPVGRSAGGLPIGAQLVVASGEPRRLLDLAAACERLGGAQ